MASQGSSEPVAAEAKAKESTDLPQFPKSFGRKTVVSRPVKSRPMVAEEEETMGSMRSGGSRLGEEHWSGQEKDQFSPSIFAERTHLPDEKHLAVPWSDVLTLTGHEKLVCSLDLERSGSRLATVSADYTLKLWDFGGMDGSFQAFRTIQPREAHSNRWCRIARKGGQILVAPGGHQAKIYSRDGDELVEFEKGDMYIRQMKATKGHCATVNCCEWSPVEKGRFLTCSNDCTMRLWDAEVASQQLHVLLGPKQGGGKNVGYSVCQYSPDGSMIVGALTDGTVQVWDPRGSLNRPEGSARNPRDSECSSLAFDEESRFLLSRSGSEMRIWDCRLIREPVHIWRDLADGPNSCLFSPTGSLVATASGNMLKTFSRTTFALVEERDMGSPVHQLCWNAKINQIACGMRDGTVQVLYSPDHSVKGALLCKDRPKRQAAVAMDFVPGMGVVHNPDVEDEEARLRRRKEKKEGGVKRPRDLTRPDLPVAGSGFGGQLGSSSQHQMMKKLLKLENFVPEDPRQALLKYDAAAKANPMFIAHAYAETQPEPIFDEAGLAEYVQMEQLRKAQDTSFKPKK